MCFWERHAPHLCVSCVRQEHKVLLTGTPLQNSVEELFSLLNFLEPLQFPSESTFLEEFGDLKTDEQVCFNAVRLHAQMSAVVKEISWGWGGVYPSSGTWAAGASAGVLCCSLLGEDNKDLSEFSFLFFFPIGKEASGHSETHDVEETER